MKIALVGHSQIPVDLYYPNAVITYFKKPGALARFCLDYPETRGVLNDTFDLVIIWVGSNDIRPNCGLDYLPSKIADIATEIQNRTGADIRIVLIEPRDCPPGNRNQITRAEYIRIQKGVNKRIIRRCLEVDTWAVIYTTGFPAFNLDEGGVHFNHRGRIVMKRRICGSIARWAFFKFPDQHAGGNFAGGN
ncbi:MAG: SGNH/GDSL hydrolase family protein [Cyanobacteria bacterium J06553_1]